MTVEEYLVKYENINLDRVKAKCDRINSIMSQVEVGDYFYVTDTWSDAFRQEVTRIIDKETGVVEVIEKSINSKTFKNVNSLYTYDEMLELQKQLGQGLCERTEYDKTYGLVS